MKLKYQNEKVFISETFANLLNLPTSQNVNVLQYNLLKDLDLPHYLHTTIFSNMS